MSWTEADLAAYYVRQGKPSMPGYTPGMSVEAALLRDVRALVRQIGGLFYHTYRSDRSEKGFPDCVILLPPTAQQPHGRLLFAELKSATGKLTSEQAQWVSMLETVPGITVHIWKPADWNSIVTTLTRKEP